MTKYLYYQRNNFDIFLMQHKTPYFSSRLQTWDNLNKAEKKTLDTKQAKNLKKQAQNLVQVDALEILCNTLLRSVTHFNTL